MKTKEVVKKIYIAEDGKEFLVKEECEKYEKFCEEILSKIKYFRIMSEPDLTETGLYQKTFHVAVFSPKYYYAQEIAEEFALRKYGHLLMPSVQGYGFQPSFDINSIKKEDWENGRCERFFLSSIPVDGFPQNFDFMKEWGFK